MREAIRQLKPTKVRSSTFPTQRWVSCSAEPVRQPQRTVRKCGSSTSATEIDVVSCKWGRETLRVVIAVDPCTGATRHTAFIKATFLTRSGHSLETSFPELIGLTTPLKYPLPSTKVEGDWPGATSALGLPRRNPLHRPKLSERSCSPHLTEVPQSQAGPSLGNSCAVALEHLLPPVWHLDCWSSWSCSWFGITLVAVHGEVRFGLVLWNCEPRIRLY